MTAEYHVIRVVREVSGTVTVHYQIQLHGQSAAFIPHKRHLHPVLPLGWWRVDETRLSDWYTTWADLPGGANVDELFVFDEEG